MQFDLSKLDWRGESLVRPECVLATQAGYLYVSDFRGGVTEISPTGEQTFFGGQEVEGYGILKPNGIALLPNGDFLIAHLGDSQGGIFKITRSGQCSPFVTHIDGKEIPPSNFIYLDHQGRMWLTVSTRKQPRAKAYRSDVQDGFIALIEEGVARIVADDLGYTNELYVDPDGQHLYVNATFSRELIQFDISTGNQGSTACHENTQLINPKIITHFGEGTFPDGLTRDTAGDFWVTSIVSNRVIRVNKTGQQSIVLQDNSPEHLAWVEQAFAKGEMGRAHLDEIKSQCLQSISSLAFSGQDLTKINLGCLLDSKIPCLESSEISAQKIQGIAPAHWCFDDHRLNN
jgi:sugar lactone lactonase YvrE